MLTQIGMRYICSLLSIYSDRTFCKLNICKHFVYFSCLSLRYVNNRRSHFAHFLLFTGYNVVCARCDICLPDVGHSFLQQQQHLPLIHPPTNKQKASQRNGLAAVIIGLLLLPTMEDKTKESIKPNNNQTMREWDSARGGGGTRDRKRSDVTTCLAPMQIQ